MNYCYIPNPAPIEIVLRNAVVCYKLTKMAVISSNRMKYFENHIYRCKKDDDKVRLILLFTIESVKLTNILSSLKKIAKEAIDLASPKPIYYTQKLLNA